MSTHPSIAAIKAATAARYGLAVSELEARDATRRIARPRHVAMFLSRRLTLHSYPSVAREFGGRHHTTVMHACQRIASLQETDAEVRDGVADLLDQLSDPARLAGLDPAPGPTAAEAWAIRSQIGRAKRDAHFDIAGSPEAFRQALFEVFDERLKARALKSGGARIEILTSPGGSWSKLEIAGDIARLTESGAGWEAGREIFR